MADESKKPEQIKFFFEVDKDYRIAPANGVWGGITTRGDIQLDFFVEKQAVPQTVENEIDEHNTLGREISRDPPMRFTRVLQVGVLLSVKDAEVIAQLIMTKVEEMKKIQEGM